VNIRLQSYKKVCKLRAIGALKMTKGGCNTLSKPRKAIEGGKNGKRGNDDDIWISRFFICGF